MKNRSLGARALAVAAIAGAMGLGAAAAGTSASAATVDKPVQKGCTYNGKAYGDRNLIVYRGDVYECRGGTWHFDDPFPKPRAEVTAQGSEDGPVDVLSGKCHFEGQADKVEHGQRYRCHNGQWVPVGGALRPRAAATV